MSSSRRRYTDGAQAGNPPRREAATWPWTVGARRVLAGGLIIAAMGLALFRRSDHPKTGDAFTAAPTLVVDANTAPARVLTALPHVGPTLVRAWVAARTDRPFSSPEDAQSRVRGLGPATLAQIAPYLRFEPSTQSDVHYVPSAKGRKPSRSRLASKTLQSIAPPLVAKSSALEIQRQLSIARHDR
jgi:competence protein ComEA